MYIYREREREKICICTFKTLYDCICSKLQTEQTLCKKGRLWSVRHPILNAAQIRNSLVILRCPDRWLAFSKPATHLSHLSNRSGSCGQWPSETRQESTGRFSRGMGRVTIARPNDVIPEPSRLTLFWSQNTLQKKPEFEREEISIAFFHQWTWGTEPRTIWGSSEQKQGIWIRTKTRYLDGVTVRLTRTGDIDHV